MAHDLDRGFQLLSANRADLAEREFRAAVASDPSNPFALSGLSLALSSLDRGKDAVEEAIAVGRAAVAAGPDEAIAHAAHARALLDGGRAKEALEAARAATRLDPSYVFPIALEAAASMELRRPADALAAAERGLALDADDTACANIRGLALARLNRRDASEDGLRAALARDPESPTSHAALGHTLLLQNRPKEAAFHFREALRLDPTNQFAREGLMHTLRSRVLPYRVLLWWIGFCHRMPGWVIVAAIVGSFFVPRMLASLSQSTPALAPIVEPARILFLAFVVLTWAGTSLFNGLLLATSDGRLLLGRAERIFGAFSLLSIAVAATAFAASWWTPPTVGETLGRTAIVGLFLLLPISIAADSWGSQQRRPIALGALLLLVSLGVHGVVAGSLALFLLASLALIVIGNVAGIAATARRQ
jgi:tetratricopeptide (TPR) repeat protein